MSTHRDDQPHMWEPSGVSRRLWRRWTASGDSLTEDSNSPEAQRNELLRQRVEELAGDRRQAVAKLKAHEICDALCGHTVQRLLPLVDDSAEKSKAETMVAAVDRVYRTSGCVNDYAISIGEEKLLLQMSWREVVAFVRGQFPQVTTDTGNGNGNGSGSGNGNGNDIFVSRSPTRSEIVRGDRSPGHSRSQDPNFGGPSAHSSATPFTRPARQPEQGPSDQRRATTSDRLRAMRERSGTSNDT
ncbi:hypothetical protein KC336_g15012 [Hortaea werneckii]|nr:hypothetical protein KC336_g15012 [Hortaea werneckii]